jgi:hypothetical protein
MAIFFEPSSMTGSAARMCVDRASKIHQAKASVDNRNRETDATADDCIDSLRGALAEVWSGEVRRHGRSISKKIRGATEGATGTDASGHNGRFG